MSSCSYIITRINAYSEDNGQLFDDINFKVKYTCFDIFRHLHGDPLCKLFSPITP